MNTTIQCELILFTICPIILSKEQICKLIREQSASGQRKKQLTIY